jgi:hypothetical protein
MPVNRALGRNVQFYDASAPDVALGGFIQNGSVTEASFLEMLGILLVTGVPVHVQERASGHIVSMKNNALRTGMYDIYCDGKCSLQKRQNILLNLARGYCHG